MWFVECMQSWWRFTATIAVRRPTSWLLVKLFVRTTGEIILRNLVNLAGNVPAEKNRINESVQGKGEVRPRTGHEGPEGQIYSSTLPSNSELDGSGRSKPRLGRFTPKTRFPPYRRLGGPQGRSGRVRKISPPPDFDPRTIRPVACRYPGPRMRV